MKRTNSRLRHLTFLTMVGALLLPSASFAAGWAGKYVPLRTTKSIKRANKSSARFKVNMRALDQAFRTNSGTFKRANSVEVKMGPGQSLLAPTHVWENMRAVPYSDTARAPDAKGISRHGESELNRHIAPGEVHVAVKNHRMDNTSMQLSGNVDKEAIKFQDTHAQFPVGVKRVVDGRNIRGVMTFNNPQRYPGGEAGPGRFGGPTYNSVNFRPKYPAYLLGKKTDGRRTRNPESRYLMRAFNDNVRTMMLGFNAVTVFPGDYNGGDPLGAFSPDKVKEATRHMINAVAGTAPEKTAAQAFFNDAKNQVYCAELGMLSFTAGLHVPLNSKGMRDIGVSTQTWANFKKVVGKHNKGEVTPFRSLNGNEQVAHVKARLSARALKPMWAYAPEDVRVAESKKMAFKPMTSADMVSEFLRLHVGKVVQNEQQRAAIEGAFMQGAKPALMQMAELDQLPADHPKLAAFNQLYAGMQQVVSTPHANREAFKAALRPLMETARQATGPQDGTGKGFFAPPHLYHVMTKGFGKGEGLIELDYAFHNVHWSQMEQSSNR